eukprot:714934-Lingulodinium_polyedra.AAC.1
MQRKVAPLAPVLGCFHYSIRGWKMLTSHVPHGAERTLSSWRCCVPARGCTALAPFAAARGASVIGGGLF